MTEHPAISAMTRGRIVPVVVIDDPSLGAPLGAALLAGGIECVEVTLRTEHGLGAIESARAIAGLTVGAGTVLTADQVRRAADAGAEFIVSPGLDDEVICAARELGLPVVPGVATATEVQRAVRLDLAFVKLFPAGALGGRPTIDALAGPFPDISFLPSGGVTVHNAADYLASPSVFAVSGSWMVPRASIAAGDFAEIERLSAAAVAAIGAA